MQLIIDILCIVVGAICLYNGLSHEPMIPWLIVVGIIFLVIGGVWFFVILVDGDSGTDFFDF